MEEGKDIWLISRYDFHFNLLIDDDAKTKEQVLASGMDGLVKKPLKKDVVKSLV